MRRGMSSFTGWKRCTGEFMEKKKNRARFSIKFNENDPAHEAVIRFLEKQGPHSKAQFIVNAVLHYVNSAGQLGTSMLQVVDRAAIEEIIMEILSHKNTGSCENIGIETYGDDIRMESEDKSVKQETGMGKGQMQSEMDEKAFALIADTMLAFRNG